MPQILDHELEVLDVFAARAQIVGLFGECLSMQLS
jgi:hypothetical protein